MPRFEVDVLTTSTVTYEVEAVNEDEARKNWGRGLYVSEFVETEEVTDVRADDDRFYDDDELTDEYEEEQLEVDE